ncbi:ADP-ribosylglycohydrolase family protein [Nocardiopsis sp. NPDC049922]|uniref:ADP-ribosylglycohydrolase family protein n=1 Tax=Nocardiopsis sp. NPDC049922 TaxID=3155157 RepID=UPI0034008D09
MEQRRVDRAVRSLRGLAVGDAFGDQYFLAEGRAAEAVAARWLADPVWHWTDDTAMALSVVGVLVEYGRIDQDRLAEDFAGRYDPGRGYGPSMNRLLRRIGDGEPWRGLAAGQFGGEGSHGNGAAMRVAPLGAYFADDLDRATREAARSAVVTHTHHEAVAGAVAVALAAALAVRGRGRPAPDRRSFLDRVAGGLEPSKVRSGLLRAARLAPGISPEHAAATLGSGDGLSAADTVPFALWCAAGHPDDLTEALWTTVAGLGDRDTTCAIAGGVVAARSGRSGLPDRWSSSCEPLPAWVGAVASGHDAAEPRT